MEWGTLCYGGGGWFEGLPLTGNAEQFALTASATPNARPGSYTEMISSTPFAAGGFLLGCGPGTSNVSIACEIGIGANGSEQNIIQDFCFSGNSRMMQYFYMPVAIPSGSRVAGRITSTSASATAVVYGHILQGGLMGLPAPGRMYALGITPTSGIYGTAITSSIAAHNATWTQVIASTTRDIRALAFSLHTVNASPASQGGQLQIAVGAASSEQQVIESVNFIMGGAGDQVGCNPIQWFDCQIPSGSRISARIEVNSTADVVNVALYGLG